MSSVLPGPMRRSARKTSKPVKNEVFAELTGIPTRRRGTSSVGPVGGGAEVDGAASGKGSMGSSGCPVEPPAPPPGGVTPFKSPPGIPAHRPLPKPLPLPPPSSAGAGVGGGATTPAPPATKLPVRLVPPPPVPFPSPATLGGGGTIVLPPEPNELKRPEPFPPPPFPAAFTEGGGGTTCAPPADRAAPRPLPLPFPAPEPKPEPEPDSEGGGGTTGSPSPDKAPPKPRPALPPAPAPATAGGGGTTAVPAEPTAVALPIPAPPPCTDGGGGTTPPPAPPAEPSPRPLPSWPAPSLRPGGGGTTWLLSDEENRAPSAPHASRGAWALQPGWRRNRGESGAVDCAFATGVGKGWRRRHHRSPYTRDAGRSGTQLSRELWRGSDYPPASTSKSSHAARRAWQRRRRRHHACSGPAQRATAFDSRHRHRRRNHRILQVPQPIVAPGNLRRRGCNRSRHTGSLPVGTGRSKRYRGQFGGCRKIGRARSDRRLQIWRNNHGGFSRLRSDLHGSRGLCGGVLLPWRLSLGPRRSTPRRRENFGGSIVDRLRGSERLPDVRLRPARPALGKRPGSDGGDQVPQQRLLEGLPRQLGGKKHVAPEIHRRLREIEARSPTKFQCFQ